MASAIIRYFEADVRCYHCGHPAGILRRRVGSRAAVLPFRRHSDGGWILIRTLTGFRCDRCSGPLFAEETQERCCPLPDLEQNRPRDWHLRKRRDTRLKADRRAAE